jgi:hypothetical protein
VSNDRDRDEALLQARRIRTVIARRAADLVSLACVQTSRTYDMSAVCISDSSSVGRTRSDVVRRDEVNPTSIRVRRKTRRGKL